MLKHFFDKQIIYIECFQFWKQKLTISNWLFSQVLLPCFISKTILIPPKYKDREWRTYVVPCTVWFRLFKGLFFVVGGLHLNSSTNYIPPLIPIFVLIPQLCCIFGRGGSNRYSTHSRHRRSIIVWPSDHQISLVLFLFKWASTFLLVSFQSIWEKQNKNGHISQDSHKICPFWPFDWPVLSIKRF